MKLLTVAEAAEELGIAITTMRYHCQQGNIPAEKVGRDWVIAERDLDWFRENKRDPGRPPKDEAQ